MDDKEAKETLKTMKENIDKKYLKTRNSVAIETLLNLLENQKAEIEDAKEYADDVWRHNQELKEKIEGKECVIETQAHNEEVLNKIIDEKQAEIEKKDKSLKLHTKLEYQYKNDYLNVIEELKKKDKQIDLMAKELVKAHEWFYSEFDNYTKEDFKQYFENKAEEEK